MLKRILPLAAITLSLTMGNAVAQEQSSWKKIGIGVGIAAGATSIALSAGLGSLATASDNSEPEVGESHTDNKINMIQLQDQLPEYIYDYRMAKAEGSVFNVEDIKQIYVRQRIQEILADAEYLAEIKADFPASTDLESVTFAIEKFIKESL